MQQIINMERKQKMAKKIISMLLVLLMIGSTLIACGKKDPVVEPGAESGAADAAGSDAQSDSDAQSSDGGAESTEGETLKTTLGDGYVDVDILKKLPQADYNGKQFSIALPNEDEHGYQFAPTGKTGRFEDDVIYQWKKKVQDTFNVTISYKADWGGEDQYASLAGGEILAGGNNNYQLYGHYAFRIHEFILTGCFQDWNALGTLTDESGKNYLDLDEIRWDQTLNKEVTYNGKLLSLTGDLGVSKLQSAMATFVNANLLEEYCDMTTEELYAIVKAGDWDFETFKGLVAQIYEDDSSPGKSVGDTLGYYSKSGNSHDVWFPAFNIETTKRDEVNNTITATFMDAHNVSVIDELRKFYYDSDNVMSGFKLSNVSDEVTKFRNEELGFCTTQFRNVYGVNGFNNMNAFGIVPTPKWEAESQELYRTKLNDRYTIWGLPVNLLTADRQFTAHITDALCAESSEILYYQYYEVLLKNRYSKEPGTAEMVDMVMEHPHFDTVIQFGTYLGSSDDGYPYLVRNLLADRNKEIQSSYDAIASVLSGQLQTIYDCYK